MRRFGLTLLVTGAAFLFGTEAFAQSPPAVPDKMPVDPGGVPIIEGGKLIDAIGCSGGAGVQDEVVCKVGAAAVSR